MPQKVILCIVDGFGIDEENPHNPIPKTMPWWMQQQTHAIKLQASGEAVGLPKGQMGNSEVGHMTIGMGQIILQDLARINTEIKNLDHLDTLIQTNTPCHLIGLCSSGGIHSHKNHYLKILAHLEKRNIPVYLHMISDGRDTKPSCFMDDFFNDLKCGPNTKLATLMGRFYAMDRDQRWDRTEKAVEAMLYGRGNIISSIEEYVADNRDEFLEPGVFKDYEGVKTGGMIMVNFRPDRIIQILKSLTEKHPWDYALSMTDLPVVIDHVRPIFSKSISKNGLGEWVASRGLRQLRIAETEKYAHVSYFFNGGRDEPFPGEDRILIPSPKVTTYDQTPEMRARDITEAAITGMAQKYDLIVMNYANPDMIGHTGNYEASCKALSYLDNCLEKLARESGQNDYTLIITSDHGNIESVMNMDGSMHTSHTTNPVPFFIFGKSLNKKISGISEIASIIMDLMS